MPRKADCPAAGDNATTSLNTRVRGKHKRAVVLCAEREGLTVGQLVAKLISDNITPSGRLRDRS
jgi:hypothetical protein